MIPEHYTRLDQSAVLFERSVDWSVVTGPDRMAWLQGMVSNDVGRLGPGQGCVAAHLTPQGKVVRLMTVLAEPERFWLLSEAGDSRLASQLDGLLIMEDATIEDRSTAVCGFSLVGRGASEILRAVMGEQMALSALYDHTSADESIVVRTRLGYDFVVPTEGVAAFTGAMDQAGVARGDESLWNLVCVEAGIPRWGVDVDSAVTLPELGEETIDYQKGCYIGQEVVAKIKYLGHVNRRLIGLRVESETVPDAGSIERDGREVGRITSAVYSPAAGGVIALAFLRRGADTTGSEVQILSAGKVEKAVVADLPFVEPRFD